MIIKHLDKVEEVGKGARVKKWNVASGKAHLHNHDDVSDDLGDDLDGEDIYAKKRIY